MSQVVRIGLNELVFEDLAKSGLEPRDIAARAIGATELAATHIPSIQGRPPVGYVIPYFNISGEPVTFYRVRLLEEYAPGSPKYKQPPKLQNHIYFPIGFRDSLVGKDYLIITEGEKKAAAAVKAGFPAVAVTGVDSWRNRIVALPKGTVLEQKENTGQIIARVPSGDNKVELDTGPLAIGFQDVIDTMVERKLCALIIYDSDTQGGCKLEVQRAAAKLGYELRYRGLPINRIRQIVLPALGKKVGLDDYLVEMGAKELQRLIKTTMHKRTAFPRHPNPRAFIASRLQRDRMNRKETQDTAMAVLAELETRGRRIRTTAGELHYFDEASHTLYPVHMNNVKNPLHETTFGSYLYMQYGLGTPDRRVVEWLATQFTGEPGIQEAKVHKVLARTEAFTSGVVYQLNDSHYAVVTPNPDTPLLICENGSNEVLFQQGQVEPLDPKELEVQFYKHLDDDTMLWRDVLDQMNFAAPTQESGKVRATPEQLRDLVALLYYISPWLRRWRGTQLPIELVIGEAGSGKSSLLHLRQLIIMGKPYLSNLTTDIRDWYAGITARGGLHVLDNVHFTPQAKDFRQRLSDEICRLITEPNPHIEMRRLYTTNDVVHMSVDCSFAVTAIEQPFWNVDLIQRAAIFRVEAIRSAHDSEWVSRQLKRGGGRISWVAHHLATLHKFLKMAITDDEWDPNYHANHRLANYEQALVMMGRVFGMETDWIPAALTYSTQEQMSEGDLIYHALKLFVQSMIQKFPDDYFHRAWSVSDINEWAREQEDFAKMSQLTNPWKLGRYLQGHKQSIATAVKLYYKGTKANKAIYGIYKHDFKT